MKRAASFLLAALAIAGITAGASAEETGTELFQGQYQWSYGGDDELSAEFAPDGENAWRVKFRFRFNGRDHIWKGTARGSLVEDGEVTGTARNKGGRTWTFAATLADETLSGSHTETTGGRNSDTGTFTLRR